MITVQPIHYTSDPDGWHRFAETIGFRAAFPTVRAWSELDAGGILAIHEISAGDPLDGTTDLHLLVSDLDAVHDAVKDAGAQVAETILENAGKMLTITVGDVRVTVSGGPRSTSGDPSVLPIHYVRDLAEADRLYRALGLRPRIAAVHHGEPQIELSFEYAGDLDALTSRLDAAGYAAEIVDEAYNRTLRVSGPGGRELWINGVQHDLYGYRLLG